MGIYLVWHGGDGSDNGTANTLNPDSTAWNGAETTLTAGLALATASGDVILVDKDHTGDNALSADTTYTPGNNISIICVDKDNSNALSAMGTATWLGSSTVSVGITLAGAYTVFLHGLTFRNGGSSAKGFTLSNIDAAVYYLSSCYLWLGTTSSTATITFSAGSSNQNAYTVLRDTTFRFAHADQKIYPRQGVQIIGGRISADSTAINTVFSIYDRTSQFEVLDFNMESALSGASIIASSGSSHAYCTFYRCKLPANYVLLATQSPAAKSSATVLLSDCSVGDTHGIMHYADALGSIVSDFSVYFTSGSAAQSWKIVTTSNCSRSKPFITPWISVYHTGTSAITPRFEILRDGSTTAYQTDQIGAEFSAKVTSGTVVGTTYSDYISLVGTAADQDTGAGTGSWTGDTGAWSGKIDSGSPLTPAENGEILGRAIVSSSTITVYLDPQIRW